jgi:DNA-3-methyladenine glycosylase II
MGRIETSQKDYEYFRIKDPILYQKMIEIGSLSREGIDYLEQAVITSIISQQISTKAAKTVIKRLSDQIEIINAKNVLKLGRDSLKLIGISYKKTDNILYFANKVISKELNLSSFKKLTNQEIINELILLPGIGIWTAEMILLFSLHRDDVISYSDLMIREGMKKLYQYDKIDKKIFNKHALVYANHASIASL